MAFRKPVRVDQFMTDALNKALKERQITVPEGWTIWVTNTVRGRCAPNSKTLTVPTWALELAARDKKIHCNDTEYAIYYACHEIAHIMAPVAPTFRKPGEKRRPPRDIHGVAFMKAFMSICPARLQYFELGYKPRNAAAAGIRRPQ
jgi:hypothetical protein